MCKPSHRPDQHIPDQHRRHHQHQHALARVLALGDQRAAAEEAGEGREHRDGGGERFERGHGGLLTIPPRYGEGDRSAPSAEWWRGSCG